MAWQTAAGAELRVSLSHPATFDDPGYSALVAGSTLVGEVSNIGEFGKEFQTVTFNSLSKRATDKRKGSYNNGTLNPTVALDPSDAGQTIMEQLLESDDSGTFFVVLQDGTTYGMDGYVTAFRPSVGEVDSVVTATCTIEVSAEDVVKLSAS